MAPQTRRNLSKERQARVACRQRYDSDLSSDEWALAAPLLEKKKKDGRGRPPGLNYREIIDALFYLSRTGCQWRLLPHDFPEWHYVFKNTH